MGMDTLARLLVTNGDWVLTVVRVVLGITLFAHGAQKLLGWFGGHGLSATVRMFRDHIGIPAPLAYLAIAAEFFGGLGLIVGLLARIAALGIAITMAVAMLTVHLKFGFFMNWFGDKQGHGFEYHLLALALALVVIVHGAGAFSLDRALYRHLVSPAKVAFEFNLVVPFFFRVKPAFVK
jgi:putative oxidoreductase